jgi:hypothetical protein
VSTLFKLTHPFHHISNGVTKWFKPGIKPAYPIFASFPEQESPAVQVKKSTKRKKTMMMWKKWEGGQMEEVSE